MASSSHRAQGPPAKPQLSKEVISDSEEERVKTRRNVRLIVISSDSSDDEEDDQESGSESEVANDATIKELHSTKPAEGKDSGPTDSSGDNNPRTSTPMQTPQNSLSNPKNGSQPRHMGVIELSDSDDSAEEAPSPMPKASGSRQQQPKKQPGDFEEQTVISHGGFDDWLNDGSILVLDEPRSARKPKRISPTGSVQTPKTKKGSGPFVLHIGGSATPSNDIHKDPPATPLRPGPKVSMENTASQSKPRRTPGKKAQAAAEQERREMYAHELFVELNHSVFQNGLPIDTKLVWSKRLLTTAGRARWHRSRTGEQTSSIELAEKILDCDERIRNTLSHEMCHLASWVIDQAPGENHGSIWKAWARKVMKARPEIEISTRHDYEIVYKYQWRCEKCTKIYGRHSKSIKPQEVVCGFCREGTLVPLFATRQPKAPQTPKTSRQAATKPQDSPQSLPRLKGVAKGLHNRLTGSHHGLHIEHSCDSDNEPDPVLNLTKAMSSVIITAAHTT